MSFDLLITCLDVEIIQRVIFTIIIIIIIIIASFENIAGFLLKLDIIFDFISILFSMVFR